MAVRYLTEADGQGWIDAIRTRDEKRITLAGYLKVNYLRTSNNRDYFIPYEGPYQNTEFSVARKNDGATYLVYGYIPGAATIIINPTKAHLWYGTGNAQVGPIFAQNDTENPLPDGTYEFQVPDFPHGGFNPRYLSDTTYALVWYPIPFDKNRDGQDDERYLHYGERSRGCVTVRDSHYWTKLYKYLYNRRLRDGIVGTIKVDSRYGS